MLALPDELELPERWDVLRYHPEHARGWNSTARVDVVVAGRRSGKTEVFAKRRPIIRALGDYRHKNGRTCFCAPTQDHAKDIYWNDLKALVPERFVQDVKDSYPQTILLKTGYKLEVRGLDKPQRIVGVPLDELVSTETDDLKSIAVIDEEILPALGTTGRPGRATFEGVPNGKVILWELRKRALREPDWNYYEWPSSEVLLPHELDFYRRSMDPDIFDREWNASFANFEGRAYYPFDWKVHALEHLEYDPSLPLIICFDFNVEPGVALLLQEQVYKGRRPEIAPVFTAVIGEVWIEKNSNTEIVCRRLIQDWGGHQGPVIAYGDSTGGARGSAKVQGSDWDLIGGRAGLLSGHFGRRFRMQVPKNQPNVKPRVNSVNRRLLSGDLTDPGSVRMLVDPARAPHVCEDLDGVLLVKGGAFEIDKKKCEEAGLTHLSDALGYYLHEEFPVVGHQAITSRPIRQ